MQSFPFKPVRPTDLIPAWPASSKIKIKIYNLQNRTPHARRHAPTGAEVAPAWVKQPGRYSMHQNHCERIPRPAFDPSADPGSSPNSDCTTSYRQLAGLLRLVLTCSVRERKTAVLMDTRMAAILYDGSGLRSSVGSDRRRGICSPFPEVRRAVRQSLGMRRKRAKPIAAAKPLKGFGGHSVMEIVASIRWQHLAGGLHCSFS